MNVFGIEILGGLCNMLFCVATGEWIEHKYGINVVYPNAPDWFRALPTASTWSTHSEEYKTIFKRFDWFKNQNLKPGILKTIDIPFRHDEIVPEHGLCYAGYFQSYKNFDGDFIRQRFDPSDAVKARLDEYEDIWDEKTSCIHVRRGNYLKNPNYHPVQTMEYYNSAMQIMKDKGVKTFVVFSDDITWCIENFTGSGFVFIDDTDYVEMFLMMRCDNNIIGNSSFSCFPALIAPKKNRTVIYPSNWFTNNYFNASDICPPEWIKI